MNLTFLDYRKGNKKVNTKNKKISDNFKKNVSSVHELVNFDEIVQTFYLDGLKRAEKVIEKFVDKNHPSYGLKNLITSISNIHENKSLRPHYEVMLNQCVVLLVSYFTSAIEDLFESNLTHKIKSHKLDELGKEEIKVSINELEQLDFNLSEDIGRIIIDKKRISFQDMQSIAREFKDHFGFELSKDKHVNNIILGQACRHSIVHSGGIAKQKTIRQISKASPRDVKNELKTGDKVLFSTEEIEIISKSMIHYIDKLVSALNNS